MHSCSTCVEDYSGTRQVWSRNLRVQILVLVLVLVLALVPVLVLGVFQAVEDTLFDVQNNTA
ncbi:hypothetical protein E4U27_000745, partial [Claviceps purpurea]